MLVPRSMSTRSTRTPGTLKPDGSETCPDTVAVSNCAWAKLAVRVSKSRRRQLRANPDGRWSMDSYPLKCMRITGQLFPRRISYRCDRTRRGGLNRNDGVAPTRTVRATDGSACRPRTQRVFSGLAVLRRLSLRTPLSRKPNQFGLKHEGRQR